MTLTSVPGRRPTAPSRGWIHWRPTRGRRRRRRKHAGRRTCRLERGRTLTSFPVVAEQLRHGGLLRGMATHTRVPSEAIASGVWNSQFWDRGIRPRAASRSRPTARVTELLSELTRDPRACRRTRSPPGRRSRSLRRTRAWTGAPVKADSSVTGRLNVITGHPHVLAVGGNRERGAAGANRTRRSRTGTPTSAPVEADNSVTEPVLAP